MTAAREMEGYDVVRGRRRQLRRPGRDPPGAVRPQSVTILVRRPDLSATMSSYLIGEIEFNPRITVEGCREVVDGGGDGRLEWIEVEDTSHRRAHPARDRRAVPAARRRAHCDWLPPEVARDTRGFVLTGRDVPCDRLGGRAAAGEPGRPRCPASSPSATSAPGSMKRVAAASGEGASVVPLVHAYLAPVPEDDVTSVPVS